MKQLFLTIFIICSFVGASAIHAQTSQLQANGGNSTGTEVKTQILILGTPHLSEIGEDFSPALLDSLMFVLEKYRPDVIGIEAQTGAQVAQMKRQGGPYGSYIESVAEDRLKYGLKTQEALNISWEKANMIADSLLGEVQHLKKVADEVRLELVNHLTASYRLHTAALQWSYVSDKRRSTQSVIPEEIATALSELLQSAGERASISIRLAHNLKLQQIYPIDDQLDKDLYSNIRPQLNKALTDSLVQIVKNASYLRKYRRLLKRGVKDKNLYPVYEYVNSPAFGEQDYKIQWQETFLQSDSEVLRKRLALWEVRNLHTAAHIRKASAHSIGGRILVTIGFSHKPFLDLYLKEMMGVEVIDLNDILKN